MTTLTAFTVRSLATKERWIKVLKYRWVLYRRNARTRRQLHELPPHLLRDVGIEPHQVRDEVRRSFWD
ncbi:DUF1127 domain-containing protein [Vibrio sp. SM6]|uniref:DUF1127 domain-containing protein n=1 Tax=Vibrio agarilyticus TaxID=2726741 RepID=A0A7X8TPT2_9VIBR|nr:DUF1127 domain-containing protein [Vibrio agarilyticus]NLS12695.1 DUF1127 domain-containing protein [Vibrio agarilyticus]